MVSAQAVIKWERGLNFPDLSLLEPLGDCLGLDGVGGCCQDSGAGSPEKSCCWTPCGC